MIVLYRAFFAVMQTLKEDNAGVMLWIDLADKIDSSAAANPASKVSSPVRNRVDSTTYTVGQLPPFIVSPPEPASQNSEMPPSSSSEEDSSAMDDPTTSDSEEETPPPSREDSRGYQPSQPPGHKMERSLSTSAAATSGAVGRPLLLTMVKKIMCSTDE